MALPVPHQVPPALAGLYRDPGPVDSVGHLAPAVDAAVESPGLTLALSQPARGVIAIRALGELDMATAPRCRGILHAAVVAVAQEVAAGADHGWTSDGAPPPASYSAPRGRVVCRLDEIEFLSISAARALLEADHHAREQGVELMLVASTRPVLRVLQLSGLDRQLAIHRTLKSARAAPAI